MARPRSHGPPATWLAGAALCTVALTWLWAVGMPWTSVQGSTEAWLMAHAQRVAWIGRYAVAAEVGGLPNLATNPLYPWLISVLSPSPGAVVAVGHGVAGASLGAAALALWLAWRPLVGPWAAVGGASAVLLPTLAATAGQARYDSLAIALVLGVVAAASAGLRTASPRPWLVAGVLAGLAWSTREYLGVVAAVALVLPAALASRTAGTRRARQAPWVGVVLLGLVAAAVPLVVGLDPTAGLRALVAYGGDQGAGGQAVAQELLGPPVLRVGLALGVLGGLAAAWRSGASRRLGLPLVAALVPLAAFPLSAQQSPQYYVLGQVLVLSGAAGLLALAPSGWIRRALTVAWLGLLGGWSSWATPRLLTMGSASGVGLHSESWSDSRADMVAMVADAAALAGSRPLAFSSQRVENLDALAQLHLGRPVAWFFDNEFARVDDFMTAYQGQDLVLVLVDEQQRPSPATRAEALLATWHHGALRGRAWLVPGQSEPGQDPCTWTSTPRGLCLQRDWLLGGFPGLRSGAVAAWSRAQGPPAPGP